MKHVETIPHEKSTGYSKIGIFSIRFIELDDGKIYLNQSNDRWTRISPETGKNKFHLQVDERRRCLMVDGPSSFFFCPEDPDGSGCEGLGAVGVNHGKLTVCYGKSPFFMGKSTINGDFP